MDLVAVGSRVNKHVTSPESVQFVTVGVMFARHTTWQVKEGKKKVNKNKNKRTSCLEKLNRARGTIGNLARPTSAANVAKETMATHRGITEKYNTIQFPMEVCD